MRAFKVTLLQDAGEIYARHPSLRSMSVFQHAPFNRKPFQCWALEALLPVLNSADEDLARTHAALAMSHLLPKEFVTTAELQTRRLHAMQAQIKALQDVIMAVRCPAHLPAMRCPFHLFLQVSGTPSNPFMPSRPPSAAANFSPILNSL